MKAKILAALWIAVAAGGWLVPARLAAHCDGLDGPVIAAARKAIETRDVSHALIWVKTRDEEEIKEAFQRTLAVRRRGPDARELADTYFLETLVRIHRAGEGAPYTGLKPAGRDLGPAIPAADKALREGDAAPLRTLLLDVVEKGLDEKFKAAASRRDFKASDVQAGRAYVRSYVEYIHFVERLYEDARRMAHGHFEDGEGKEAH